MLDGGCGSTGGVDGERGRFRTGSDGECCRDMFTSRIRAVAISPSVSLTFRMRLVALVSASACGNRSVEATRMSSSQDISACGARFSLNHADGVHQSTETCLELDLC